MTRSTPRQLSEIVRLAKIGNASIAISIIADAEVGNKALVFVATVNVGANAYKVASANGKVKTFAQIDDLLKVVAIAAPTSTGTYPLSVTTGTLLAASIPANVITAAIAKKAKLEAIKIAQQFVLTDLNTSIGLMTGWDTGSILQAARLAETIEQRDAVAADIAAIAAEVLRLTV